jgi:hypothetical protein
MPDCDGRNGEYKGIAQKQEKGEEGRQELVWFTVE